jgi:CRP-like cAMP-binding protein
MLAVTAGRIRLTLGTAQGRELMLRDVEAGDVLGEFALTDGRPRSADAVAVEATTAILLRREPVLAIAAGQGEFHREAQHRGRMMYPSVSKRRTVLPCQDIATSRPRSVL